MTKENRHVVNSLDKVEFDNETLDSLQKIAEAVKSLKTIGDALKIIANVLSWFKKYAVPLIGVYVFLKMFGFEKMIELFGL